MTKLEKLGPGDEIRFRKSPFTGPLVVAMRDDASRLLWVFEAHMGGGAPAMLLGDEEDLETRKWRRRQKGVTMYVAEHFEATNTVFYALSMDCEPLEARVSSTTAVDWIESERADMPLAALYSHILLPGPYPAKAYAYANRACVHGLLVTELGGTRRALAPNTLATISMRLYDISRDVRLVHSFVTDVLAEFLQPGAQIHAGGRGVVVVSPQSPLGRCRSDALLLAMALGHDRTHAAALLPASLLVVVGGELYAEQNPLSFAIQCEKGLAKVCEVFNRDRLQQYRAADPNVEFFDPPRQHHFAQDHCYLVDMVLPSLNLSRVTTPSGGRILVPTSLLETYLSARGPARALLFSTTLQPGCRVAWFSEVVPRVRWAKHWARVVATTEDNERLLYVVPMDEACDHDTLRTIAVDTLTSDAAEKDDLSVTIYGICTYRHVCDAAPVYIPPAEVEGEEVYVNFKGLGPLQAPVLARDEQHAICDITAYKSRRTAAGIRLRHMIVRT